MMKNEKDLEYPSLTLIAETKEEKELFNLLRDDFENANLHDICRMFDGNTLNIDANSAL